MKTKKKIYISGAITNDPNYLEHFAKAEAKIKADGHDVFNPCCIPNIFSYDEFIKIDLAALDCCDGIYMLKGWRESKGANIELQHAIDKRIIIGFEQ